MNNTLDSLYITTQIYKDNQFHNNTIIIDFKQTYDEIISSLSKQLMHTQSMVGDRSFIINLKKTHNINALLSIERGLIGNRYLLTFQDNALSNIAKYKTKSITFKIYFNNKLETIKINDLIQFIKMNGEKVGAHCYLSHLGNSRLDLLEKNGTTYIDIINEPYIE